MSAYMELKNATLDIPIFNASRSFRTTVANRLIGGRIGQGKKSKETFVRALDNVSLFLQKGDRLGLVGHNGAGKTTLLRVLSGIYKLTQGEFSFNGSITPLFNASLGLDLDDTGYNNIYTVGMFLGMSSSEISSKIENIIEFTDLGDFIHLPARIYSAGMLTRLSFGIATSMNPDILLMDEGIGAGDESFARKAESRLKSFYDKTSILVIASHSEGLVRKLCNKAILMEHGKIKALDTVDNIYSLYYERIDQTVAS